MPATPARGLPYPTLASANDPPRDLQLLAEALDTQIDAIDTATFKRRGLTVSSSILRTTAGTEATIPEVTTSFEAVAGRLYRLTLCITTYSTAVVDVVQLTVDVGASRVGEFPKTANSAPAVPGTSNYHVLNAFYTAPAAGPQTVTATFKRVVGTGTITVAATALSRASLLIEDLGAA